MEKNLFKTFQPFIKKCGKSSLPMLSMAKVENGRVTISDIETWVHFKTDLPDGMYKVINGETFLDPDANIDDYPTSPTGEPIEQAIVFGGFIASIAPCTAKDELRPVMNGIHIDKDYMVASDAHVLRYIPIADIGETTPGFNIIFPPSPALLTRIKADSAEPIQIQTFKTGESQYDSPYARFMFCDCTITLRLVDGEYPNYLCVIPDYQKNETQCYSIDTSTITEMAKFEKATTIQKTILTETQMVMKDVDLGIVKLWQAPESVPLPDRNPDGILMPIGILEPAPGEKISWKPTNLEKIALPHKGSITIGFYDNTKAIGIWFNPIKTTTAKPKTPNPKTAKAPARPVAPSPTPPVEVPPTPPAAPPSALSPLLIDYSEKAIAVFNAPENLREAFIEAWGKYSKWLKHPVTKEITPGWVFSKKRTQQIQTLLKAS
jgi:hypothetical protein